ncbi:hypothetical protein Pan241w_43960 [Gimesia alba]|uniref:Secreted protein n=1 Tax=Gimesia alba TaxID=2527973 RepID=A0A517RK79_9PLAN|nr:hypothetical protein [Gimesia alba]QDT44287.1 hypothetical protein Pan241w_43960 [Gimesia alba]
MKLLSYRLLLLALCLLPGCGSGDESLDSGEITSEVKSEMEKEKEEVFAAESANREQQAKQAKGKK